MRYVAHGLSAAATDDVTRPAARPRVGALLRVLMLAAAVFVVVCASASAATLTVYTTGVSFSPNGDGQDDTAAFYYTVSSAVSLSAAITDSSGQTVRTIDAGRSVPGSYYSQVLFWTGQDDAGARAPDGTYTLTVETVDSAGATESHSVPVDVDTRPVGRILTPSPQDHLSGSASFVFEPREGLAATSAYFQASACRLGRSCAWNTLSPWVDGTWRVTADTTSMVSGANNVHLSVSYTDRFGNGHYFQFPSVPVVVDNVNPVDVRVYQTWAGGGSFSPNGDGQEDTAGVYYGISDAALVDIDVLDEGGTVVRALATDQSIPAQPSYASGCCAWVEWDGRDDDGQRVSDGEYRIRINATSQQGGQGTAGFPIRVDTAPVGAMTEPATDSTLTGTVDVAFTPAAGRRVQQVLFYGTSCPSSCQTAVSAASDDGSYRARFDTTMLTNGANTLRAQVQYLDADDRTHYYSAPAVAVLVRNVIPVNITVSQHWAGGGSFSPDADSHEDRAYITYGISTAATVTVTVADSDGNLVRTVLDGVAQQSHYYHASGWGSTAEWDGRNDAGQVMPDGAYRLTISALTDLGAQDTVTIDVDVDTRTVGALTAPVAGAQLAGTVDVRFAPRDGLDAERVDISAFSRDCSGCSALVQAAEQTDGSYALALDTTRLRAGANAIRHSVTWLDRFGQRHTRTGETAVTVTNAYPVQFSVSPGVSFSPDGDGTEDTMSASARVSDATRLSASVQDADGNPVRALFSDRAVDVYGSFISLDWDGESDAGQVVPDGTYRVLLSATNPEGSSGEASFPVDVDTRPAGTITAPADGATLSRLARLSVTPREGLTTTGVAFDMPGRYLPVYAQSADGTWSTTVDTRELADGPARLDAYVFWNDRYGRGHASRLTAVDVTVDNSTPTVGLSAEPPSGPAPLQTALTIAAGQPRDAALSYTVDFGDGSTPATGTITAPYNPKVVTHTYQQAGVYTPTVQVSDGNGHSAGDTATVTVTAPTVNTPPVAALDLAPSSGPAPLLSTAMVAGSDDDAQDELTYRLDWGDGSAVAQGDLPAGELTHSYARAGTYVARLEVSDGRLADVRTRTVTVALAEPLAAAAGDDRAVSTGEQVGFDAGGSRPTVGIDSYTWDFGDGNTTTGPAASHAYTSPGTYTVTLTVRAGTQSDQDTATVTVSAPPPAASGLTVDVSAAGGPLSGADVLVVRPDGTRVAAATDGDGRARLVLPDGEHTVYVGKAGFLPQAAPATVSDGTGDVDVTLTDGDVAGGEVTSKRLTVEEIEAAGIDPADPDNQHVYEFEVHLSLSPTDPDVTLSGWVGDGGFAGSTGSGGGGGGWTCVATACRGSFGGYDVYGTVQPAGADRPPSILWLVIPGKASFLKEFFNVSFVIQNLASSAFTMQHGTAALTLPAGLSLAPTAAPQSASQPVADIPGRGSRTVHWIIRGDTEGEYRLGADYAATLEPLGMAVNLHAEQADPLKVWGGSALEMVVDVEDTVSERYPYRVRVGLRNVADVPVYNPQVELLSESRSNYIYQPLEQLAQGAAMVAPGETFWTRPYVLVPSVSGTVNLDASFVRRVAGNVTLDSVIQTRPPLYTPATAPKVTLERVDGRTQVTWEPVDGASGYRLFLTPDQDTPFTATPVPAQFTGPTTALVDATDGFLAVSATMSGVPTMFHPLTDLRAVTVLPADVNVSLDGPAALNLSADGTLSPNPFDVTALAGTAGPEDAENVTVTLNLQPDPDAPDQGLSTTDPATVTLGELAAGAAGKAAAWKVTAAARTLGRVVRYKVTASGDNFDDVTVSRSIVIPAAQPSCADVHFVSARGSGQDFRGYDVSTSPETRTVFTSMVERLAGTGSKLTTSFHELAYPALGVETLYDGVLQQNAFGVPYLDFANLFINVRDYIAGVRDGLDELDEYVGDVVARCARRKAPRFVLAGYSQGSMVVHEYLQRVAPSTTASNRVAGAALVANPERLRNTIVPNFSTAAPGDGICPTADHQQAYVCVPFGTTSDVPDRFAKKAFGACAATDMVCDFSGLFDTLRTLNTFEGYKTQFLSGKATHSLYPNGTAAKQLGAKMAQLVTNKK